MNVNNFGPFDANVWGTVSDWLLVLLTLITAIFLYFTLTSQRQVQNLQTIITRIETLKTLDSVKPVLEFENLYNVNYEGEDENLSSFEIIGSLNDYTAYGFSFEYSKKNNPLMEIVSAVSEPKKVVKNQLSIKFVIRSNREPRNVSSPQKFFEMGIILYYIDKYRNKYSQILHVNFECFAVIVKAEKAVRLDNDRIFGEML